MRPPPARAWHGPRTRCGARPPCHILSRPRSPKMGFAPATSPIWLCSPGVLLTKSWQAAA
eukprot:6816781-Pyramimonas_sp.AAC.1